jgi:hypothetical protein
MITPTVFLPVMNHVLQTASRHDYFSGLLRSWSGSRSEAFLPRRAPT